MLQQQKLGNFINKLQFLLGNCDYEEIICWDNSETMIDILNEERMEAEIIPLFFRHSKFESFVRQLNLYGFKKVKQNGRHRFTHPLLLKGEKLTAISSNKNVKKTSASAPSSKPALPNGDLHSHPASSSHTSNSNSLTENGNQVEPTPPLAPTNSQTLNIAPRQHLQPSYTPEQYFHFWNMMMMQGHNNLGGFYFMNPLQTTQ